MMEIRFDENGKLTNDKIFNAGESLVLFHNDFYIETEICINGVVSTAIRSNIICTRDNGNTIVFKLDEENVCAIDASKSFNKFKLINVNEHKKELTFRIEMEDMKEDSQDIQRENDFGIEFEDAVNIKSSQCFITPNSKLLFYNAFHPVFIQLDDYLNSKNVIYSNGAILENNNSLDCFIGDNVCFSSVVYNGDFSEVLELNGRLTDQGGNSHEAYTLNYKKLMGE